MRNGATALQVIGKTQFSRSGVATVAATRSGVTVGVSQLTAGSFALATLQSTIAGVTVAPVVCNIAASTIRISLNKAVTTAAKVGWIVMESP